MSKAPKAYTDADYMRVQPRTTGEASITDERCPGLQMIVRKTGTRFWEYRYTLAGRRRKISIPEDYPGVSITNARGQAEKWAEMVAKGEDPVEERKKERLQKPLEQAQQEQTFRAVALKWLDAYAIAKPLALISKKHIDSLFTNDVFPLLGDTLIGEVTGSQIETLLNGIVKATSAEKAHRTLWHCQGVFNYAIEKGLIEKSPAFNKGKWLPPIRNSNRPAIIKPESFAKLLDDIEEYTGSVTVKAALQMLPMVMVRPGELINAEWTEIDLAAATWVIPAVRMKGRVNKRKDHLVPLSRQVVALLERLQWYTSESRFVFASPHGPSKPISNTAMNKALHDMGYKGEQCGHGFRASAKTILLEQLDIPNHIIELQLAHAIKDPNHEAYNRAQFLPFRKEMMQRWADYLDKIKRELKASQGASPPVLP